MKVRRPFAERPYALAHQGEPYMQELVEMLHHYDLDNGWTVSVLNPYHDIWEAWAWPTGAGSQDALTAEPLYFDTEAEAFEYRDEIAHLKQAFVPRDRPRP